jgi:hypothetical protein
MCFFFLQPLSARPLMAFRFSPLLICLIVPLIFIRHRQLQERLAPCNVKVSRPDMYLQSTLNSSTFTNLLFCYSSKAVADGAIGFYCDHHISARMSKFVYGVQFLRELDPTNPDHERRKERLCELPSGPKPLPDAFDHCIPSRVNYIFK